MITEVSQTTETHPFKDGLYAVKKAAHHCLPPLITGIKGTNNIGQTLFIKGQATTYFNNPWILKPLSGVAAASGALVTFICKARAIKNTFGPEQNNADALTLVNNFEQQPLSFMGKTTYGALLACAALSGVFDAMYGNLGAEIFAKTLFDSLGVNKALADILTTVLSVSGFAVAGACYAAYDFTILRANARHIAGNIHYSRWPRNRAAAQTLLLGFAIAFFMAAQTIFTTKPALSSIPHLTEYLGAPLLTLLSEAAGLITFTTVTTFFPTIYDYFHPRQDHLLIENTADVETIPANTETTLMKTCRYTTYAAGTVDSTFNTALGIFLAITFSMNTLFNADPYGWVIGIAILGGLYALILNAATAIRPGYLDRMQSLQPSLAAPQPEEAELPQERVLPVVTAKKTYGLANKIGLFFKNVCGGERRVIVENVDIEMAEFALS